MNTNENPPKAMTRLRRIKAVSKTVRNILVAVLIVQGLGILALVMFAAAAAFGGFKSSLAFENSCGLAPLPFVFMVTLSFFRFFDRLKNGRLFDSQTVEHLQTAGKWWIGAGTIQVISASFGSFMFAPRNIMGSGDGIVAGFAVVFIAWIMDEGRKIQEEQELTV
jgi:hypothetical protein